MEREDDVAFSSGLHSRNAGWFAIMQLEILCCLWLWIATNYLWYVSVPSC